MGVDGQTNRDSISGSLRLINNPPSCCLGTSLCARRAREVLNWTDKLVKAPAPSDYELVMVFALFAHHHIDFS